MEVFCQNYKTRVFKNILFLSIFVTSLPEYKFRLLLLLGIVNNVTRDVDDCTSLQNLSQILLDTQ